MGTFGEKLRKQREQRGITLDSVANTTKISTRMLKALEDEQFDQLPGGVFNKGFVRAYARQVGLNEEEAVNDYLAALAEGQVDAQPFQPNFRVAKRPQDTMPPNASARSQIGRNTIDDRTDDRRTQADRRTKARRSEDRQNGTQPGQRRLDEHHIEKIVEPHIDERGIGDLPITEDDAENTVIGIDARRASQSAVTETRHQEQSVRDIPSAPLSFLNLSAPSQPDEDELPDVEPTAAVVPSRRAGWERVVIPLAVITVVLALWTYRRSHRVPESEPVPSSQVAPPAMPSAALAKAPAATDATTTAAKSSISSSSPSASTPPTERDSDSDSDVSRIIPARPPVVRPKPLPAFTLIIRASENSWVSIMADGQAVAQENLFAPAATSVRATKEIVVKARNAAGISFMLNGKDIPASGAEGESRTFTFDVNGLRDSRSAPAAQQP